MTREREDIEILAGRRGRAVLRQAAVRLEDLIPLLQLPPAESPTAASNPPTKAEVDAVLADNAALRRAIDLVISNIKARLDVDKRTI